LKDILALYPGVNNEQRRNKPRTSAAYKREEFMLKVGNEKKGFMRKSHKPLKFFGVPKGI
jgi:hypothetical protein